jgi:hypothetical protein
MALTLDATAKGADANSYVTVAEATSYFEGRLDPADTWANAVSGATTEEVALVMATARLELESFYGIPTTTTQRLKWPRIGTYDSKGDYNDSDLVPRCVKEATYELALALLQDETMLDDTTGLQAFSRISAGSLSVDFRSRAADSGLPKIVRQLLAPVRTSHDNSAHIVRS